MSGELGCPKKGAIGVEIMLDTGDTEIASATVLKIKYKKPSGDTGEWTAVVAEETWLQFTTTAATDLDQAGMWKFESYVELPGFSGPGCTAKLRVMDDFEG